MGKVEGLSDPEPESEVPRIITEHAHNHFALMKLMVDAGLVRNNMPIGANLIELKAVPDTAGPDYTIVRHGMDEQGNWAFSQIVISEGGLALKNINTEINIEPSGRCELCIVHSGNSETTARGVFQLKDGTPQLDTRFVNNTNTSDLNVADRDWITYIQNALKFVNPWSPKGGRTELQLEGVKMSKWVNDELLRIKYIYKNQVGMNPLGHHDRISVDYKTFTELQALVLNAQIPPDLEKNRKEVLSSIANVLAELERQYSNHVQPYKKEQIVGSPPAMNETAWRDRKDWFDSLPHLTDVSVGAKVMVFGERRVHEIITNDGESITIASGDVTKTVPKQDLRKLEDYKRALILDYLSPAWREVDSFSSERAQLDTQLVQKLEEPQFKVTPVTVREVRNGKTMEYKAWEVSFYSQTSPLPNIGYFEHARLSQEQIDYFVAQIVGDSGGFRLKYAGWDDSIGAPGFYLCDESGSVLPYSKDSRKPQHEFNRAYDCIFKHESWPEE